MSVHNRKNQSRLCPGLGRNIEPFEVADTPDGFEKCEGCQCIVTEEEPKPKDKS